MPKVNIDLGRDMGESMPVSPTPRDKSYPTFYIETNQKIDFPHEGEMTIRFKKTGSSMNEREDGEARYSCTIEVRKIVELYPDKDEDAKEPKTADVLDDIAKTVMAARSKGKSSY